MKREKAIVILSGGLDSAVSMLQSMKQYDVVLALTYDYGQISHDKEVAAARALCERYQIQHQVLPLDWLKKITTTALVNSDHPIPHPSIEDLDEHHSAEENAKLVWVPNRNGLMIHIAACYAEVLGAKVILTGFNQEEAATFADNSLAFIQATNQSLAYSTLISCRVESPVVNLNKKDIVLLGKKLKLPFELIWSCYEGREKMCGACESCLRSQRAYQQAGLWTQMKKHFSQESR